MAKKLGLYDHLIDNAIKATPLELEFARQIDTIKEQVKELQQAILEKK